MPADLLSIVQPVPVFHSTFAKRCLLLFVPFCRHLLLLQHLPSPVRILALPAHLLQSTAEQTLCSLQLNLPHPSLFEAPAVFAEVLYLLLQPLFLR